MSQLIHCDLAIIGAGAGGLSLAAGAAQLGLKVILIEQGLMGGDCLNFGCVPSKSLLAAAKSYWHTLNNKEQFGISTHDVAIHFETVMRHVKTVIATLAVHDSLARFEQLGVQVLQTTGHFIDENTVGAGSSIIKAKYFVIATGSSPTIPAIPGLDQTHYFTNETIFNLNALPSDLLIIGGGPIGCELAQAFAMLGSKVTLLEGFNIMTNDDPEAVDLVRNSLISCGIHLREQISINQINTDEEGQILISAQQQGEQLSFKGTHLLIAAGRKANTELLNCQVANIELSKKGVLVDKRLRTTNKRVYAIGDAAGKLQFTHVANDHAGVVLRNIAFKLPAKVKETAIPWVTFTEPELAHVGLSEAKCKDEKIKYKVLKLDYSSNDRAQTEQETSGFIKVLVTPKGIVLGATIVGHEAGELLLPWIMAVRENKSLRMFTDTIVPYPTLNELSKRIASQFYAPKLFSRTVKKLVQFLSYF